MDRQKPILVLAVILLCASICFGKYSGGTGEPNDPYLIATAEDMNAIGADFNDWDKHFLLVSDINLADYTGTQFNIIGTDYYHSFTGVFDGNDHKVWSLTWSSTGRSYIGLFGYVGIGGLIKNLGIENVNVNAADGDYIGGLVGRNYGGMITDCYSTGSVSGTYSVGGLAGSNCGAISNCYATDSVTGEYCIGGLVGDNGAKGMITNCYSTGSVIGNDYVGGLVGRNGYTILSCYAIGAVDGNDYIGGLVGENTYRTITSCYSTGSVSGNEEVGGLIGYNVNGYVWGSFWDVNTSGQISSAGGTGLPTEQMQIESTFTDAGWDFVCEIENGMYEVWTIKEAVDYPRLLWQCFKNYQEWLAVGEPPCWLCPRQCHGDADNTSEYIKGKGYYYVHFKDLNVLLTAWNIKEPNDGNPYPGGLGIAWPDPNICADFDHGIEGGTKTGYFRVHFNDLNILLKYWNVKEPPDEPGIDPNCLDCP